MAIIKPRTKVIFFRVSQDEFAAMEHACDAVGARSLSDFVRIATRRLISAQDHEQISSLQERLQAIDGNLQRLCARMEQVQDAHLRTESSAPAHDDRNVDRESV